jgi:hypothetical protein
MQPQIPFPRVPAMSYWSRLSEPKSHRCSCRGLRGDIDPPLEKQTFDLPQRQRKSDLHHHGEADDLG